MKIKKVNFHSFRNNEHFQFQTEFKALVEAYDPQTLNIEVLFGQYLTLYQAEDEALIKIAKNSFSEVRGDADRLRDRTFRGLDDTVKAARNHFDPEVVEAARLIRIPIDAFGNVAQLPLNEETSAIFNLIQELRAKQAANISKLSLAPWIDKLEADNRAYETLVEGGYKEESEKTELKAKQVRAEVDVTVRKIFDRIEALIVVDGESDYAEFVRQINVRLEKYDNIIAQRAGAAKAKREKEKAAAEAAAKGSDANE